MAGRSVRRARLYQSVRSAHLERAHQLSPATIIFGEKRYDFDAEAAIGLNLVPGHGLRAARWLWRNRVDVLEVNEPLMLESAVWTALALLVVRARQVVGGPKVRVVSYAIENRDPLHDPVPRRLKARLGRLARHVGARLVWRALDRIAFGTEAAQQLYLSLLGPPKAASTLIWALPSAEPRATPKQLGRALFVSAFSARKGVPELLAAWPRVRGGFAEAGLVAIGKGGLLDEVNAAAAADPSIRVLIDPPRETIRAELHAASVLVLPSQPTATWREQVGLPIVEGLAAGCTVVTTDQTGLANWLRSNGHRVIEADAALEVLAEALLDALHRPLDPEEVRGTLPPRDGRLAADDWMMSDAGH